MALVNPDTTKIPVWRRRPERMEHPIRAWRAWDLDVELKRDHNSQIRVSAMLTSVAVGTVWEGPVIRAHKRPVDPAYWDAHPKGSEERSTELIDTFENAGIWAVKTREQVIDEVCGLYTAAVYGEVDLWGRVAQFALGYRGEVCMIKKLYVFNQELEDELADFVHRRSQIDWELMEKTRNNIIADLSRRYECEVEVV